MTDTIFALSSGSPPAALAVLRVSGPQAREALAALAGSIPQPRRASYRLLRNSGRGVLDHAIVLWFPGPDTATGEDLAEFHLHGGRAVVSAVEAALAELPKLRRATAGEFTRRAFTNGRIDLAEAEGLADLLAAETELQRRSAIAMADGAFSSQVQAWRDRVLVFSAAVEAVLDFGDEDDVSDLPGSFVDDLRLFHVELSDWLARPRAERLKEGFRIVIAGPPNAGKSTLFNALVEDEAAITSPLAGTTRDVLTRAVSISGVPFVFADTAGLRDDTGDEIEAIGISRAKAALEGADLILWLGPEGEGPEGAWEIAAKSDRPDCRPKRSPRHVVSAISGAGLDGLRHDMISTAMTLMPRPGEAALSNRQHALIADAASALATAARETDPLLRAEGLRLARVAFDALIGRTTTEDMLNALFGRFCIGK
ncbi:MAG TPA: tRNA uridine-5-carboxymethylaminomethyl(34) synthesis GTPase MnmE [Novosphingobium sp.]|nr:tRNA uridine-5-carboxymethylaminomethyl(34) synthesis GTPase MnmE [Novosphingobium sp.]